MDFNESWWIGSGFIHIKGQFEYFNFWYCFALWSVFRRQTSNIFFMSNESTSNCYLYYMFYYICIAIFLAAWLPVRADVWADKHWLLVITTMSSLHFMSPLVIIFIVSSFSVPVRDKINKKQNINCNSKFIFKTLKLEMQHRSLWQ